MQEQYQAFMAGQSADVRPPIRAEDIAGMTTIAVAPGAGLTRVFESLGVGATVSGGPTMNPSTEDLLKAINAVHSDQVIILPNDKNILPAAEQARKLAQKNVEIVPTRTVPQGIAALLAFNFQNDLASNIAAMTRAAQKIRTLEITTAVRSVKYDNLEVCEGQVIGLVDGELAGAGDDRGEVTRRLLREMQADEAEIVTLYHGDSVNATEAEGFSAVIQNAFPRVAVEVINGGQPHYHYIISVE
jgi:dihydroxyacetone kinase-like predicted kinase